MAKCMHLLAALTLLLTLACNQEEPPLKVDLSRREKTVVAPDADAITYAYLPQYSHTVSYRRHHRLVAYLARKTGLKIRQIFPDTFDEHMQMVGQGKIDISYSNPFIYVKIAHRYGARAFCRIVEADGRRDFRGQIICRADNNAIGRIADCRGKRWIAVDPGSAGGYLYPLGLFMASGIMPADFREIAFSPGPGGKQEKVVLAVYAGKYDIGTIREGTLEVVHDKVDIGEIRVVASTPRYPGWVYAARAGLAPAVVEKIKNAMLALDYDKVEDRRILAAASMRGILPCEDSEFDSVRSLARRVGIDLER